MDQERQTKINPQLPKVLEWQAYEYEHYEKRADWFWAVGATALALIILAILLTNPLFSILIFLAAATMIMLGARAPRLLTYRLERRGLVVGEQLYPYPNLKSFWILDHHNPPDLIISADRWFLPHILVPLPGDDKIDHQTIHDYLEQFLPAVQTEESLTDVITDYLGF